MRFISTNIHGLFDYLIGAYLIAMPWIFGFAVIGGPETWLPIFLGVGIIAYSLLTDYEWGVARNLPVRAHLILDVLVGVTLIISTPYFGFFDVTWWAPHLVVGLFLIVFAALTRREPEHSRPHFRRPRTLET